MERALRHGLPLVVILFDIDNFKQYNDTYGHLQGDATLKAITKTVQKLTRKEDFVARYGGEEFIIVLSNTSIQKAKEIADRIRKKIVEMRILPVSKNLAKGYEKVTISMGIAQLSKKEFIICCIL